MNQLSKANWKFTNNSSGSIDENFLNVYVLLKYLDTLRDFDKVFFYNGLADNSTEESKTYIIAQAKHYLSMHIIPTNQVISKAQFIEKLLELLNDYSSSGGKQHTKQSLQLKKSKNKVVVNGRERVVYVGPRGGKYIKSNDTPILVSKLTKSNRVKTL